MRSRFSTYEQNAYNFDLSGNLTAWGGGADPANNSYLIHDCSCNAPFTSNNPCIATYKPLNRQFAVNTAVSGRSRIARLKYNTKKRVAVTKKIPFGLLGYPKNSCEFCKRDFKPSKGRKGGDNKSQKRKIFMQSRDDIRDFYKAIRRGEVCNNFSTMERFEIYIE